MQLQELSGQAKSYQFQFTGTGFEYFKIWAFNMFMTACTFGIYSAWATARSENYFHGNTLLNDKSFGFHATGGQIFKGRAMAFGAFIIASIATGGGIMLVIFAGIPFMIWGSYRFSARTSSYCNVFFNFDMDWQDAYKLFIGPAVLYIISFAIAVWIYSTNDPTFAVISLSLLALMYLSIPYFQARIQRSFYNHVTFGSCTMVSKIEPKEYYKIYAKFAVYSLLFAIALALLFLTMLQSIGIEAVPQILETLFTEDLAVIEALMVTTVGIVVASVPTFALVFFAFQRAYLKASMRNYKMSTASFADVQIRSTMSVWLLCWVYVSNAIGLIFTLGLFYPWARVRVAKLMARSTEILAEDLDSFTATEAHSASSLGDELANAFDADTELGIGL